MEANSLQLDNVSLLRQDILDRIEEILSKIDNSVTDGLDSNMKASIEKKLKSATIHYKIALPISIVIGVFFTLICLAQMAELTFFGKWENSALFLFLAFSFTISTLNQRRELEQYKQLLYLLNMLERLESIEMNTAKV